MGFGSEYDLQHYVRERRMQAVNRLALVSSLRSISWQNLTS